MLQHSGEESPTPLFGFISLYVPQVDPACVRTHASMSVLRACKLYLTKRFTLRDGSSTIHGCAVNIALRGSSEINLWNNTRNV